MTKMMRDMKIVAHPPAGFLSNLSPSYLILNILGLESLSKLVTTSIIYYIFISQIRMYYI